MGKEEYIAITHFINPQLFWYHKIDVQTAGFKELQRIEESVQLLYTAKQSAALVPHRPIVGEVVAIAFLSWNKFIRARIEYIAEYTKAENEYIVWALDYGFPFRTRRTYVRKLPESYAMQTDHIRCGGIANIIPAEMEFDFLTTSNNLISKRSWSKRPVELLEKLINDAASISFVESFTLNGGPSGRQYFGDVKIVNHVGVEFMVSEYLLKLETAMKCTNGFKEKLVNLRTASIPCWQTNSGDVKIIDNKLNSLNVDYAHGGSFNLSGTRSDFSCDNFAKQKVMDWCQRNQNLDKLEENRSPLAQFTDFDASDLSFDDSVSVSNYKEKDLHETYEDTLMGCAGTLHERRKKKYEGKRLPPKPPLEVFEVIPGKNNISIEKSEKYNSAESETSTTSGRAKLLLELRKKHQKLSQMEKNSQDLSCKDEGSQETQSKTGTKEFLQICKEINEQSTRLAKLKELRKRRAKRNSESDQEIKDTSLPKEPHKESEDKSESCGSSVMSSRLLLLKKIKEKHSKQFILQKDNCEPEQVKDKESTSTQAESVVSSHAAKLIKLRKKVTEKNRREVPVQSVSDIESKFIELAVVDTTEKKDQVMQGQECVENIKETHSKQVVSQKDNNNCEPEQVKDKESTSTQAESVVSSHAAKLIKLRKKVTEKNRREVPVQSVSDIESKFIELAVVDTTEKKDQVMQGQECVENVLFHHDADHIAPAVPTESLSTNQFEKKIGNIPQRKPKITEKDISVEDSTVLSSDTNYSNDEASVQASARIDELRRMVHSNPFHVMSMVPGGYDVGKLVKRNNEDDHWHTKKTTLNESYSSTRSSSAGHQDSNRSKDFSNLDKGVARRTEDVEEQNFRLTRSRKERKKSDAIEEKNLLDVSLAEDLVPPPILPNAVTPKVPVDLLVFIANETNGAKSEVKNSRNSLKEEKLINLSDTSESMNANFTELNEDPPNNSATRGVSVISNAPSEISFDLMNLESPEKTEAVVAPKTKIQEDVFLTSSSSSCSFEKINPIEAQDAPCLPPVTSKWRDRPSSDLSTAQPKKIPSSQSSAPTALSSGDSCLFKNESNIRLPQVAGEASLKTNMIEHLVLAHSHVKVSPIENMSSAMFAPVVHKEMENMRLTKMYRIQSYAWAHLIRGNSFFVVNPARTGKSWCYLPPICSMVNYRTESNVLPQSYGPVAVIMAPSSVQVEKISRQCRRLLASSTTKISVVPSYAYRNSEEVKIELHNGCGILIITPQSLRRLLVANETESLLNMERIQFVVLDDVDMMISHFNEFNETLHKFFGPVLRQECGKLHFQLVVTSKIWTRQMVKLLKISSQPMLCIGDFLEAAVYAKANISIKLQSKSEKMSIMVKFLQKCSYSVERIVIVCNSVDEVDEVESNLVEVGLACLTFTDRTPVEYQNLIHEWKIKAISHEILVTMDSVLPELMIQNATILIHFSLSKSWTKFNFRFSVFLQKHHNFIKNAFDSPTEYVKSVILLDEENNAQLPRLIEFMKHHDQLKHIHPDILKVAERVIAEREESRVKNGVLMCPKVLEFGSCDESSRCIHRHQLTKYDIPLDGIPTEGEIRVKILEVLSPTHYIARLLTHKTNGTWEVTRRSNEFGRFALHMHLLFISDDSKQIVHWPLRANDMCVCKSDDSFHRCRILEVPPIVHENIVKVVNVKVKLIDSGSVIMCKSNELLVIPEMFVDFPAQAVDIRLSGVKPFDNERVWDTRSTRTVKNWIMTEVGENDCLQASIDFALIDTIWIQNLVLMEKLNTIRGYALKVNVKRSLIGKEFAVADDGEHLVKKVAQQNGLLKSEKGNLIADEEGDFAENPSAEENLMEFSTSITEEKDESRDSDLKFKKDLINLNVSTNAKGKTPVKVSNKAEEEWTQLRLDELNKIEICEFKDPGEFFVRSTRQGKEFQDMKSLIKEHKKGALETPHLMQNCLAPLGGVYHRAKIHRFEVNSLDEKVRARIFFCDLGEFRSLELSELRSSSKELIEFLPFQAINCKLTGIICKSTEKEFQSLIPKENCVYFANAVKEISKPSVLDDHFLMHGYEIILYECHSDKYDMQVNKLLVEEGLAEYDVATKHFLETDSKVTFTKADNSSDEEPTTFDFQQLLEHMQAVLDEEEAESRKEEEQQLIKFKENHEKNEDKVVELGEDASNYSVVTHATGPKVDPHIPALKSLYICPHTTWYETMCMIYLVIHAPDVTDYFLEVAPKRLMYSASVRGELQVLVLDFLGYVEPDQMTHEIRGLNVVVRLVKSVYMKWPRLLETSTKYPWLSYNLDAIDAFQAEQLIEMNTNTRNRLTSTSSETSQSSSNPCETFTPIVNYDQLYDPMEEIF